MRAASIIVPPGQAPMLSQTRYVHDIRSAESLCNGRSKRKRDARLCRRPHGRATRNGVAHGPGYSAGSVTPPVVRAVELYHKGTVLTLVPGAAMP